MKYREKRRKLRQTALLTSLILLTLAVPTLAAGDVASAVDQTWTAAVTQIKTVVNNVVFPALDTILVIALVCKTSLAFFDYRKHGQFEWTGIAILFACLIFTLTAPLYIWDIVGI